MKKQKAIESREKSTNAEQSSTLNQNVQISSGNSMSIIINNNSFLDAENGFKKT